MKHTINLTVLLGILLIAACQKQPPANDKEKVVTATDKPTQSTQAVSQQTTPAQAAVSAASQKQPTPVAEKIDLSQAHDINLDKDLSYLTPLFLAKTTRQMTDDQKLGLISAEYANETDGFKKRELAAKLQPQLNAILDKYQGTYLIKLPIIDQNATKKNFVLAQQQKKLSEVANMHFGAFRDSDNNPSNGYYNFDTHSFKTFCGIGFHAENNQRIKFDFGRDSAGEIPDPTYNPVPKEGCDLKVTDEAIAKKIETLIAKNPQYDPNVQRTGEIYYTVTADDNYLRATPVYAKITYAMPDTGETLISKEFHW